MTTAMQTLFNTFDPRSLHGKLGVTLIWPQVKRWFGSWEWKQMVKDCLPRLEKHKQDPTEDKVDIVEVRCSVQRKRAYFEVGIVGQMCYQRSQSKALNQDFCCKCMWIFMVVLCCAHPKIKASAVFAEFCHVNLDLEKLKATRHLTLLEENPNGWSKFKYFHGGASIWTQIQHGKRFP